MGEIKFKYIINQYGVVFELSENQPIPASTEGYKAAQKKELVERLTIEWDLTSESIEDHIFFIDVKNETMTCDRGFTKKIEEPILGFVERYEV